MMITLLSNDIPDPPPGLSEQAAEEWIRLIPHLIANQSVRPSDLRAFEMLTEILATEYAARCSIVKQGYTIATTAGGQKTHPAVRVMETARSQARQLMNDLGLTPRGREGMASDLWPLPG